jgi:NAD(P)H-nitrite reductase large subunit
VRLVLDEWCIVGALVMGDQTWSRPLEQLIRQRVDITEIRPVLVADRPDRLDRLAIFYDRWKRTNGMPARAGAP